MYLSDTIFYAFISKLLMMVYCVFDSHISVKNTEIQASPVDPHLKKIISGYVDLSLTVKETTGFNSSLAQYDSTIGYGPPFQNKSIWSHICPFISCSKKDFEKLKPIRERLAGWESFWR